jgi:hypothetical protein
MQAHCAPSLARNASCISLAGRVPASAAIWQISGIPPASSHRYAARQTSRRTARARRQSTPPARRLPPFMTKETSMELGSFDALFRRFSRAEWEDAGRKAGAESVGAARKKKRNKNKNKNNGDVNKRCQQQATEFVDFIDFLCGDEPQPQCDVLIACTAPLETCDFDGFFTCVSDSLQD